MTHRQHKIMIDSLEFLDLQKRSDLAQFLRGCVLFSAQSTYKYMIMNWKQDQPCNLEMIRNNIDIDYII